MKPPPQPEDARVWQVLEAVPDPEIPALSIAELGMVRRASAAEVAITPTYTGCPASLAIQVAVRTALDEAGYSGTRLLTELDPPWTTDWISDAGRAKLRAYGIAPPARGDGSGRLVAPAPVACPQCSSHQTEEISRFGSTPCKSLWRCLACAEPFDHFKCF